MNERFFDNGILLQKSKCGDIKAKEDFIKNNLSLVKSIAIRFRGRGCELEDLIEIGTIGLLKAMEGFDGEKGYSFSTYAFPLITGEIKRYLRDDGIIRISRTIKKNASEILKASEKFIMENGYSPKISDLCRICNLSEEDIISALEASNVILSLEQKVSEGSGDLTIADITPSDDEISGITDSIALNQELSLLEKNERSLIYLRYYKNLTQAETAKILGTSQVTVSRNEKKIINKLRAVFL